MSDEGKVTFMFVDTFSSLDDLPRKQHSDPEAALRVLRTTRRFSCFEASESVNLGSTINSLFRSGRIRHRDGGGVYPWTLIEVVDP